jgi:predicted transcriptional regulator
MAKTDPFSMRLPPELKAELQKLAAAENRSLTNFVETRLWEIVRGKRK